MQGGKGTYYTVHAPKSEVLEVFLDGVVDITWVA